MKSSWKTNTLGIVALVLALASIWAPPAMQTKIHATALAVAGSGLLAAKDGDK